jgi:isochorismate synthase
MDLDKLLLKIEKSRKEKIPFVLYKKPNAKKINALFQNKNDLHYLKDFSESGFIFAPFDDTKKSVIFPLNKCEITHAKIPKVSKTNKNDLKEDLKNTEDKEDHLLLVKKGIDFLNKNNIKKVVLSRKEEIEIDHFDMELIFKNLLANYPAAFVYIWFHPEIGIWIGATPETLLKVKGKQYKTMALAGTQNYIGSMDVNWGDKEIQEQQFVTDYIVTELANEKLSMGSPYSLKAGNLLHICTEISGEISSKMQLDNLINKLHPTPAVCGLPKKEAKEFILKNEGYDREYYTGFLGELNMDGVSDLFVNLRCMQIKPTKLPNVNRKVILYIGGGITADSDPEKEWEETVAKSEVMKKVLLE